MAATPNARRDITADDVAALAARVSGPVLRAGEIGFGDEASTINLSLRYEPDVIVGATDAVDVQAAVRFAREHGLPVAVVATGHGPARPVTEGVLITTRRMTGVTIDQAARTARVEAGVRWQQAVDEAAAHGLAPLTGSAPSVGVVGYTLGGGLSVTLGRAYGWAADQVRSIDVVTADGELRHASADTETDLFWALRGGKINFGVVTALEFGLFPVDRLYAGGLFFSGYNLREVLDAYRALAERAPDNLMSSVAVLRMPAAPPAFHAAPWEPVMVHVRVSYLGDPVEGERLIAPLRDAAPVLLDMVEDRPYREFGLIAPGPARPIATVEQFALLKEMPPEAAEAIVRVAGPDAEPGVNIIDFRHLGGALAVSEGRQPSAVDPLDAEFLIILSTVVAQGDGEERSAVGLDLLDALRPWLSDHKHANFLAPSDATESGIRGAFRPATYERLRDVKARFDPDNMFRKSHTIPPAG
ncbi:FAD-binding oxidoreductase [Streptomyces polygonati]|uniref:FAD-binding oxidoreductase n=1 Tax=Streptomyces polygonati TaxID=1617087 RepID=A0ABV8HLC0_9ACTN